MSKYRWLGLALGSLLLVSGAATNAQANEREWNGYRRPAVVRVDAGFQNRFRAERWRHERLREERIREARLRDQCR